MKALVKSTNLHKEMAILWRVQDQLRSPFSVFLVAGESTLELSASGPGLAIRSTIPAQVVLQGKALVTSSFLNKLFEGMKETVCVDGDEHHTSFVTDNFMVKIPAGTKPVWKADAEPTAKYTINAKDFFAMIHGVRHAIPTQDLPHLFQGVSLVIGKDYTRMVAIEGHRMAMATVPENITADAEILHTISMYSHTVQTLLAMEKECGQDVVVELLGDGSMIRFTLGTRVVDVMRVEARVPNFAKAFPPETKITATVNRAEIQQVLKRISVLADNQKGSGISLVFQNGTLTVGANTDSVGECTESVSVSHTGDIAIRVSPGLIKQAIESTPTTEAVLKFVNDRAAIVIEGSQDAKGGIVRNVNLVMPMRY